ncbi:MAG: UDP-N-acetylmuramoyl-tripeptide--D-alanyl-D-alanine ligase, partial [Flavobacterium sp.]|nr:UDP-N-acetylmuramoyl-tripeptide--D-alanyl-D-alanine ligase [Flavobacterium sp.]
MLKDLYDKYIVCGCQISTDTRNIKDNSLFVALKGPNFNANLFAKQAIEKGAKYALIDDPKYVIRGKTILVDNTLK